MNLRLRKGTTGKVVRVMIRDGAGGGRTGLAHDAAGAGASWLGEGSRTPVDLELCPPGSGFTPGGFREVDARAMPGLYELHLPDEVLAGPGNESVLALRFAGLPPTYLHLDLVGYDPYDSERLGLSCLAQEARHACLSSAFRDVVPAIVDEIRSDGRS